MTIPVRTLRELFRNLQAWRSLYETTGLETVTAPDGTQYNLHDIHRLYEEAVHGKDATGKHLLSPRQRQAIQMFLYDNRAEREVARLMGVSENNPVASYATQGMIRLNKAIESGEIKGFWSQPPLPLDLPEHPQPKGREEA